jgi:hypothetical protein
MVTAQNESDDWREAPRVVSHVPSRIPAAAPDVQPLRERLVQDRRNTVAISFQNALMVSK